MIGIIKIFSTAFEFLTKNIKLVLFAGLMIFAMLYINSCNARKEDKALYESELKQNNLNMLALKDSITVTLNANNEKVYEKMSLVVSDIESLQLYNDSLYQEIKNELGNIDTYIKTELTANLTGQGESNSNINITDNLVEYDLEYNYNDLGLSHDWLSRTEFYYAFEGDSLILKQRSFSLLKNEFEIAIELGTKMEGDTTIVFAKSKSDLIKFTNIQSVRILPIAKNSPLTRKYRWGLGPNIGIGYGNGKIGPYIGIGLQYNIFKF